MTIKTYIISLASAVRRRDFQSQQAKRLGFEPVWQPAVGIDDITDEFYNKHAFTWRRPLTKAELGCFLSHLSIWRIISESSEPAIILEDDAILGERWVADLDALAQLHDADYVCLETWKNKILSSKKSVGHLTFQQLHLNSAGAAGYALWPTGAKILIDEFEKQGPGLADGFINNIRAWRAWQLVPANVIQMNVAPLYGLKPEFNPVSFISNTACYSDQSIPFRAQIRMKTRRIVGELRKAKINLDVLAGKSRMHVPFQHHHFNGS